MDGLSLLLYFFSRVDQEPILHTIHINRLTSGDIFRGEFVGGVGNEQTGFTDGSVTDDDALDRLHPRPLEETPQRG